MPLSSQTAFNQLNLHERLLKGLEELSFDQPTEVQSAAIPASIAGSDLYVIAQTGSGKTAAFVLPLLQRLLHDESKPLAPRGFILVPTRELARQVVKDIDILGKYTFLKAELVTGGEDFKVQAARLRKNPDIVVATPGRALEQFSAGNLDLGSVQTLVLDEADRMLDMGFSEDVTTLANACPEGRQTALYSATKGNRGLQRMIDSVLREPEILELTSVRDDTPAIAQQVMPADDTAK